MKRSPLSFLWDNIEAFAVAIAMALVIRHFCIEAFRIPTGSMMPTLYGDDRDTRRQGDRILVDKTSWEMRAPRRFEVAVFRYPLNTNKNFIKRIGGLPGEWLRIADGDLWTSTDDGKHWRIARKPAGARDQLFFPYWPRPTDHPDAFERIECWEGTGGWGRSGEDSFDVNPSGDGKGELRFLRRVLPYDLVDTSGNPAGPYVGDVRLGFDCEVRRAGTLSIHILEHGRDHRLVLGSAESFAEIGGPAPHRHPLTTRLEGGKTLRVSFANVDDTLVVELPEDGMVELPFPDSPDSYPTAATTTTEGWATYGVWLESEGLDAHLSSVRLDRDEAYGADGDRSNDEIYKVPEGHYFMLGDNTLSSKDSRRWFVNHVELKDGTVIEWEPGVTEEGRNPHETTPGGGPSDVLHIPADVDGLVRSFRGEDVAESQSGVGRHYVPEGHLIGRAFSVFWPIHLPRLYPGATRVKLIR